MEFIGAGHAPPDHDLMTESDIDERDIIELEIWSDYSLRPAIARAPQLHCAAAVNLRDRIVSDLRRSLKAIAAGDEQ